MSRPGRTEPLAVTAVASLEAFERHCAATAARAAERARLEAALVPPGVDRFRVEGRCAVDGAAVEFEVDFLYADPGARPPRPNWRERLVCPRCGLNNRQRAAVHVFESLVAPSPEARLFIAEQLSPLYRCLARRHAGLTGAEFLGAELAPGTVRGDGVRHEDATRLSFAGASLGAVLSFDVLEHVPDYRAALRECARVLAPGGHFLFSVPFRADLDAHLVRARQHADGRIEHLLPPELHGDPVGGGGILCYVHFGWSLLRELREAGFADARALLYWSREYGYLGGEQILFLARRDAPLRIAHATDATRASRPGAA